MIEVRVRRDGEVIEVVQVGSRVEAEELVERWAELDGYVAVIDEIDPEPERMVEFEFDDALTEPDERYDRGDGPFET